MQYKKLNIDELTLEEIQPRQEVEDEPSNIGRQCLKCEHVRLASESHVPAYECPACGAVYDKVEQVLVKQPKR